MNCRSCNSGISKGGLGKVELPGMGLCRLCGALLKEDKNEENFGTRVVTLSELIVAAKKAFPGLSLENHEKREEIIGKYALHTLEGEKASAEAYAKLGAEEKE